MPVNLGAWGKVLEDVVGAIADEEFQRQAWFGHGPWLTSPGEMINQLFGDAAIEEFLIRDDSGLSSQQIAAGRHLVKLIDELSTQTPKYPKFIDPVQMFDDLRWKEIRNAAAQFSKLLSE